MATNKAVRFCCSTQPPELLSLLPKLSGTAKGSVDKYIVMKEKDGCRSDKNR